MRGCMLIQLYENYVSTVQFAVVAALVAVCVANDAYPAPPAYKPSTYKAAPAYKEYDVSHTVFEDFGEAASSVAFSFKLNQ